MFPYLVARTNNNRNCNCNCNCNKNNCNCNTNCKCNCNCNPSHECTSPPPPRTTTSKVLCEMNERAMKIKCCYNDAKRYSLRHLPYQQNSSPLTKKPDNNQSPQKAHICTHTHRSPPTKSSSIRSSIRSYQQSTSPSVHHPLINPIRSQREPTPTPAPDHHSSSNHRIASHRI
ncbi:Hypothetical predicted protein [Drosophila guanche]|uniref:Uncharacterized protein n=1 Tax=Drosophila guanche TaxID=7266 RepID=A0A3B0JWG6_DROGU|nr:Hypothetical predicted protein [Drosophila guanche]